MTEYDPDPETGVRGDEILSEHVEAVGYTPTELRSPGVYALRCCRPDDPAAAWDDAFDARPEYLADIVQCPVVVYVGAAKDVYDRLVDHAEGEHRQAALLQVCPPHALLDVRLYDDADEAFLRESSIALDLQNEHRRWYIHQK